MGVVYRAMQTATNREVAIKVMYEGPLASSQHHARFEREARILAQLKHPNIVTVHDTGSSGGRFYLVMDYIGGQALDAYMADREPSVRQTLELYAKICEAVAAAHLRGVIHRDLKPSNIRIAPDGEPHLLDFGLATDLAGWGLRCFVMHDDDDRTVCRIASPGFPGTGPRHAGGRRSTHGRLLARSDSVPVVDRAFPIRRCREHTGRYRQHPYCRPR